MQAGRKEVALLLTLWLSGCSGAAVQPVSGEVVEAPYGYTLYCNSNAHRPECGGGQKP